MYRLVIEFRDLEDLRKKLEDLLNQLNALKRGSEVPNVEEVARREIVVLFDETVRDVGDIARRIGEDLGLELKVYEASASIDRVLEIEGVAKVPVKDDLDVLRWAQKLGAILVTGDRRLARTAETYGIKVVYLPPSGVVSKEHYVLEALKRVKEMVSQGKV